MDHRLALIGDLVGSKEFPDRELLQEELLKALDRVNSHSRPIRELQITIGDEFQGTFSTIAEGLDASLQIRLELRAMVDVRFGLGWGEVYTHSPRESAYGEDGPAWWTARAALDRLHEMEGRSAWPAGWRTHLKSHDSLHEGILNAYLMCRDEIVHGMDEIDARMTLGLIRGATQAEIGNKLSVTQGAVSQRQRRKGSFALLRSNNVLLEAERWEL